MTNVVVQKRSRPEAVIEDDHVAVEPGQIAQTTMKIRNTGSEIAEYEVSPVPDCVPGPWMEAVPSTFRLMPGKEQQVILRFQPPMDSSTEAGRFPYGVVVVPDEVEHQAQIVAEGDVSVGAIHALDVRLKPRQSKGRWRGKHLVLIHNRGTDDTRVKLNAVDEEDAVSLALAPTSLTVPARTTVEAFLRVRPRSPKIMGKPLDHPYQVTYRRRVDGRTAAMSPTDGGEIEASVQGSFRHKPIISPLLIVVGLLLIGLIVLLLILRPWETDDPRRPPEPPANIAASARNDMVDVSWQNAPNYSEILVREVDCATRRRVLPSSTGQPTTVTPTGSGTQTQEMGPFDNATDHCFQVRAKSTDGLSVWGPSPTTFTTVGKTVPAPVATASLDGCTLVVDFDNVDIEDAAYEITLNGNGQPPVSSGGQRYNLNELDLGSAVTVEVRTVDGEQQSPPSESQQLQVPASCAGEGGDGGDGGDGGGQPGGTDDPGATAVDLRGQIFLVINPLDAESLLVQWQAIANAAPPNGVGIDNIPTIGIPGDTILVPDVVTDAFPGGRAIIYIRGYPTTTSSGQPTTEGEQQARSDCSGLNGFVQSINDPTPGNCFLIVPGQDPDYIDPPATTTTSSP